MTSFLPPDPPRRPTGQEPAATFSPAATDATDPAATTHSVAATSTTAATTTAQCPLRLCPFRPLPRPTARSTRQPFPSGTWSKWAVGSNRSVNFICLPINN